MTAKHRTALWLWLAAFAVVVSFFYGMDHLVMGAQGLPLHADLSPAQ